MVQGRVTEERVGVFDFRPGHHRAYEIPQQKLAILHHAMGQVWGHNLTTSFWGPLLRGPFFLIANGNPQTVDKLYFADYRKESIPDLTLEVRSSFI
jgi:hypothetical protein